MFSVSVLLRAHGAFVSWNVTICPSVSLSGGWIIQPKMCNFCQTAKPSQTAYLKHQNVLAPSGMPIAFLITTVRISAVHCELLSLQWWAWQYVPPIQATVSYPSSPGLQKYLSPFPLSRSASRPLGSSWTFESHPAMIWALWVTVWSCLRVHLGSLAIPTGHSCCAPPHLYRCPAASTVCSKVSFAHFPTSSYPPAGLLPP